MRRSNLPDNRGRLMLHRARDLLMRQRTQVINAMRCIWPSSALWLRKGVTGSRNC